MTVDELIEKSAENWARIQVELLLDPIRSAINNTSGDRTELWKAIGVIAKKLREDRMQHRVRCLQTRLLSLAATDNQEG